MLQQRRKEKKRTSLGKHLYPPDHPLGVGDKISGILAHRCSSHPLVSATEPCLVSCWLTYKEINVIFEIHLHVPLFHWKLYNIKHVQICVYRYVNFISSTSIINLLTDTPLPGDLTLSQLLQILNQRGLQHGLNVLEFSVKQESDKKDSSQTDQSKCTTHCSVYQTAAKIAGN